MVQTPSSIRHIADQYGYYTGLFNFCVGLTGNIVMILVFTYVKGLRGHQCSFYLTAESFSNVGLLLIIYCTRFLDGVLGYDPILHSLAWCKIRSTLLHIFGLFSLSTIAFSTFDQYLATNHRYSLRILSSLKLAHRLSLTALCLILIHSNLFLIFIEIRPLFGCTMYNSIIKRYYSFFCYPVLECGLPLVVTMSFSLLAYRNVRRIVRQQIPVVRRRLDRQMTALVLARVLCIVLCGLPYICVTLYEFNMPVTEGKEMELAVLALFGVIFYSLLYTNYCVGIPPKKIFSDEMFPSFQVNFYIFLLISARFRRQVKYFLWQQCLRPLRRQCNTGMVANGCNRIEPEPIRAVVSIVESV